MTNAFTVILPHRRNKGNDASLHIALSCLMDNTASDFHLLMDAAYDQPLYPRINALVEQATTECVVFWQSDMYPAPGWDIPMLDAFTPDRFITNVLVECGAVGIHPDNIRQDFGMTPETFQREAFEQWCLTAPVPDNEGWYCPVMFPRSGYLAMGGMETNLSADERGFAPADIRLFQRWKDRGHTVKRVRSYAYHLQAYSHVAEQEKGVRHT